ncbi:MAG: 3-oxoacyl-ACP reductase FabG [Deltaproteobacteria bacterium]|nr:3-oxoacyl-ACP reductase FabG [Deltaproteobacteria bacterium]
MFSLKNRQVLITGSTRGIGLAVARMALQYGAAVGVHGSRADSVESACQKLQMEGGTIYPCPGDLNNPENAPTVVSTFLTKAGKIDALVNCAGIGEARAFRGMTLENWRHTFQVNLESAMLATQAAYFSMREQRSGSIVSIASLSAHGPGKWMGADYAASKAGLVSLTHSLAFEAARFGVRVNAVSPGMVDTDMTAKLSDQMRASLGIPLQRFAKPEEIASAVLFLLSDAAAYITGQVLHVDGGLWMRS